MKLHIENLHVDTSESELKTMFSKMKGHLSVKLMKDETTNNSRNFAFIRFDSHASGMAAISMLNGQMINGRCLSISQVNENQAPKVVFTKE